MSDDIADNDTAQEAEPTTVGRPSLISPSTNNAKTNNSAANTKVSRSTVRREAPRTVEEARRGRDESRNTTKNKGKQMQKDEKQSKGDSGAKGRAPGFVTATTTSSGSDDRGTSTNNSSSDRDGDKKPAANTTGSKGESSHSRHHHSSRPHHHHHHSRRYAQHNAPSEGAQGLPPAAASSSGLDSGGDQHAKVVAHLLPAPPSSTSEGNSSGNENSRALLEPHKEPGIHKIKSTFKRLIVRGNSNKEQETDSSQDNPARDNKKKAPAVASKSSSKRTYLKQPPAPASSAANQNSGSDSSCEEDRPSENNSSSGSGTEGGYAGSASSNDLLLKRGARGECSSSSPSVSSSEDNLPSRHHHHSKRNKAKSPSNAEHGGTTTTRPLLSRKTPSNLSGASSSEIADFSSGATESKVAETMKALQEGDTPNEDVAKGESSEESITSCSNVDNISAGSSGSEDLPPSRRRRSASGRASTALGSAVSSKSKSDRKRRAPGLLPRSLQVPSTASSSSARKKVHIMTGGENPSTSAMVASALPHHRHHHSRHHSDLINTSRIGALKDDMETRKKPPIMTIGSDVMAHVLTFLEPPEILSVLTMPLSKDWISTFTQQSELWRVLCLVEPFKAKVEDDSDDDSCSENEGMIDSFPLSTVNVESELRMRFGGFRILYTNFVRCMRYLARIKDDAVNGRPPSVIDYGTGTEAATTSNHNISANQNLQNFLARARGVVEQQNGQRHQQGDSLTESSGGEEDAENNDEEIPRRLAAAAAASAEPIGVSDDGSSTEAHNPKKAKRRREKEEKAIASSSKRRKVKYGPSKITQRLLLPAANGVTSHHELPWSCAIYSIVNWMVGFADVEGIQTMCLKVLPFLLEDEQQRMTAQRAGLTDVVLRDMVMFPDSQQLHTAAFHTIVLLARPLGGREGMLFHTSMVNSSGIFNNGTAAGGASSAPNASTNGKNGIAVMLDSMRRFQGDDVLQAMSCWSLVNIALAPAQKDVLIKLGGIEVTTNAMVAHPYSAEVQFRALFALINLVIPTTSATEAAGVDGEPPAAEETITEREVLDEQVEQIVELVVLAMKNFCSSESILNRACLVLHNLSLTAEYHGALLWTPNCYQMLEWCLSNYRTDQVLQQSAAGTLHRLQLTLSTSENLRLRFNSALASQQQSSLEQAHREAVMLHEQQHQERDQQNSSQTQDD